MWGVFSFVAVVVVVLISACGAPVRAIDRGKLAHPTMTADEIAIGLDGHVRAGHEEAERARPAGAKSASSDMPC